MNLRAVMGGVASGINPREIVSIYRSTGPAAAAAWGNRQPTYAAVAQIMAQLQRVTAGDLMLEQQSALNIQGQKFRIYIDGQFERVVRPDGLGGDMIKRLDGTWWKVTFVLDRWVPLADPNT